MKAGIIKTSELLFIEKKFSDKIKSGNILSPGDRIPNTRAQQGRIICLLQNALDEIMLQYETDHYFLEPKVVCHFNCSELAIEIIWEFAYDHPC